MSLWFSFIKYIYIYIYITWKGMAEWSHYQLAWLLKYIIVWWYKTIGFKGLVWYMSLNTCFQFLNNIPSIFIHFFTYTYFQKNTNNVTKRPLSHWFSKFIHTWKLVLRGIYFRTCAKLFVELTPHRASMIQILPPLL